MQYDIVLLPEPRLAHAATEASLSLAKFGTVFTLDAGHVPHMSAYFGVSFSNEHLHGAVERLQQIAAGLRPVGAEASHYNQVHGYIGVHYQPSSELLAIQTKIVEALNPLRSSAYAHVHSDDPRAMANACRYGWEGIGELYSPHVTFTRFKDRSVEHTDALPEVHSFSGAFTALAVFELGPHGTCVRKVAVFNL